MICVGEPMVGFRTDRRGRSTRVPWSGRERKAIRPPPNEPWVWLTRELLRSEAWRTLTINDRRILDRLLIEHMNHGGVDNGRLRVSHRQFIEFGATKNLVAPALRSLVERGLIEITASPTDGSVRGYYLYRLTFLPADYREPTNEWRARRPDG